MRKRMTSLFLVLALCLTLPPTAAFAVEDGEEPDALAVEEQEPEQEGQEEGQSAPEPEEAPEDEAEPEAEADETVAAVQALIDALPGADELDDMDADELDAAYADAQAAYEAYEALTEDQQALLTGADCFEALFGWFNAQVAPLANSEYIYPDDVDADGKIIRHTVWSRSGLICEDSNVDASFTDEQFYVVKENDSVTIRGNLTVGGSCGLILCQGATLTVEGALICSDSYNIYGQSNSGSAAGRLIIKNELNNGAAIRSTAESTPTLRISSGELEIHGNGQTLVDGVKLSSVKHIHKGTFDGETLLPAEWGESLLTGGTLTLAYCQHEHSADQELIPDSGGAAHHRHCKACGFDWASEACDFDNPDHYVPNPEDKANTHLSVCECSNVSTTPAEHDTAARPTDDGTGHTQRCTKCLYTPDGEPVLPHEYDADGDCKYCGFHPVARDEAGNLYEKVTAALKAAEDGSWVMLETHAEDDGKELREEIVFNYPGKTVELKMNGYTLTNSGNPPLTVENGTLKITGDAVINQTGEYPDTSRSAVVVNGGKVIFENDLTAHGGTYPEYNFKLQHPAVYADGGELEFKGNLDLKGGLKITGSAKLTEGLTQGTFRADDKVNNPKCVSVEDASNYKSVKQLLADKHIFVNLDSSDTNNKYFIADYDYLSWNVTIEEHEHTWEKPASGDIYTCTVCGEACGHEGGYATGKCEVCGKPCPHEIADQSPVDHHYYCNDCHQKMAARIQTDTYKWAHYTDLADAFNAAENGQTVTLLDDIDNTNKYICITGDNKTVTLDLKGYTINGGWIFAGISRNRDNYTSSTLKISGRGSFITSGNLSIGHKATLDLSGWTGGTITRVNPDKSGDDESGLIVGENAGTIETLGIYSWPTDDTNEITDVKKIKLSGGSYGAISITMNSPSGANKSIPYSSMLAPGYAFQYADESRFVEYAAKAEYGKGGGNLYNVKVVKCPHEKIENGTCAYCGRTGIAATLGTKIYSESNLSQAFDAWQVNDGATLTLHQDCSLSGNMGWYAVYNGTLDLNGHTLTMAENTSMEVSGGSSVTVADNSANGGGKINGRVWVSWGSLTLESGEITSLDAENSPDGAIKLRSGKVTSSVSGGSGTVLVYRLLEDGYYLEGSALLAKFSGGPYAVKSANITVGGEKSGKIAVGKNIVNIPVSLTLADAGTTAVQFDWYRVGTDKNDLSKLASQEAAVTDGTAAYDPATAVKSLEAGWDSLAQDTDYTLVCMATGMAGAEVSWQAALTGYTLTMLPPSIEDAEITFGDGSSNEYVFWPDSNDNSKGAVTAIPTVTLNGRELKADTDYTIVNNSNFAAEVGTYTLTIQGVAPNYSGTQSVEWKVRPHKLGSIGINHPLSKKYDGTDALPEGALSNDFDSRETFGPSVRLKEGTDYEVTEARLTTADASDEAKDFVVTVVLKNKNYVYSDGTREQTLTRADVTATLSVEKADAPAAQEGALEIVNNHAASYTFNLAALLPAAPVGEYGTVTYGAPTLTLSGIPHTTQTSINSETGELTLTVDALDNNSTGKIGTITVTVTTQNYENITLTVNLNATNKIIPTGRPILSKTTLAWDEPLTAITLSGTMRDEVNGKDVAGTFAWDGTNFISGIGKYPMTWTFTPDDDAAYTKAGGFSEIEVVKATPSGAPKYTAITASGKTLADALLAVNEAWPEGTVQWVDENGVELDVSAEVKANTAYRWRFVPTDTDHYNEASGTITLYTVSHGGGSGSSSAPAYPVNTPAKAEGGTVSASPKNAKKGDTVTITVQPGNGYVLGGLTVTDKDGNSLKLTAKGNGQYTFTMPEGKVDIQPSFKALAEGVFGDVAANAYYYDAVKWAAEQGITGGIGSGLFGPYRPCTRGQIVTFLWRAAGSPEPKNAVSLTDVPADAYYAKAVAWAIENGITLGTTDTTFSPDTACTRAQSVTFLYRAANASASGAAAFTDVPSGSYYADAVKWAVDNGVTNGTTDTTFSPDTGCTRAQIVTFLWRQRKAGK